MSDKRMKMRQRRQSFRRLHGEKKAVSPVVATLILILIAVAAAAALYLWLVAWQGGVTKGIGSPGAQYTVTIGGSTSVYPFAAQAASWFEQNNSDVVISVNQGGSGAGAAAVCSGQVDIGEMSAFYSAQTLETSYGCPQTLNEQIIAYDGVDLITQTANPHGLQSMSQDTLQSVVAQASTTAPTSGFIYEGSTLTFNAVKLSTISGFAVPAQGTEFTWNQLPACAPAQATCATVSGIAQSDATNTYAESQTIAGPTSLVASASVTVNTAGLAADCASGTFTASGTDTLAVTGYTGSGAFVYPVLAAPTVTGCGSVVFGSAAHTSETLTYASGTVSVAWVETYTVTTAGTTALTSITDTETTPSTLANIVQTVPTSTITIGATAACGTNDLCAVASPGASLNAAGTATSSCGFSVCAGGTNAGIHIYYRSDVSGTTQSFLARLVAAGGSAGGTPASLQFTGCSGDNQFDGCGGSYASAVSTGENGNPAVISGVAGDANGLGYASDGLVQSSGSGVVPVNFQGYGQSVVVVINGESTALKAIAKGIADVRNGGATYATDQAYIGWRPFMNAETSPPTGEVLRYLEYVMDPANNQAIASATAEISVYASGLAGVVPITPITGYQEQL